MEVGQGVAKPGAQPIPALEAKVELIMAMGEDASKDSRKTNISVKDCQDVCAYLG
jgi:hypothetical protein